jgi:hypothetical protein
VVPNAVNTLDPHLASCEKASEIRGTTVQSPKTPPAKPIAAKPTGANPSVAKPITARSLTEGQKAYEAKRAAKAGMSLDKWLASKEREKEAEAKAKQKAAEAAKPPKPPGFFGRLLERAQRPLGS